MPKAFPLALSIMLCTLAAGGVWVRHADASTDRSLHSDGAVVVQNFYYALPGKADDVYRWRLHASEVRARLGLPAGRVLKRTPTPAGDESSSDLPDVVWECEYASASARAADVARLDATHEFDDVEAHMKGLLRQFRRATFSVAPPG